MSQYSEEEQKRFSDHDPFTCRYVTGSIYDNVQYWRERCEQLEEELIQIKYNGEKLEEKIRKMKSKEQSGDIICML